MAILNHDTDSAARKEEEKEPDQADEKDALQLVRSSVIRTERAEIERIVRDAYEFNLFDLLKAS